VYGCMHFSLGWHYSPPTAPPGPMVGAFFWRVRYFLPPGGPGPRALWGERKKMPRTGPPPASEGPPGAKPQTAPQGWGPGGVFLWFILAPKQRGILLRLIVISRGQGWRPGSARSRFGSLACAARARRHIHELDSLCGAAAIGMNGGGAGQVFIHLTVAHRLITR